MIRIVRTIRLRYGRLALKTMAVGRTSLDFSFLIPRMKLPYPYHRLPSSVAVHSRARKREMSVRNILMLLQQHLALQPLRRPRADSSHTLTYTAMHQNEVCNPTDV